MLHVQSAKWRLHHAQLRCKMNHSFSLLLTVVPSVSTAMCDTPRFQFSECTSNHGQDVNTFSRCPNKVPSGTRLKYVCHDGSRGISLLCRIDGRVDERKLICKRNGKSGLKLTRVFLEEMSTLTSCLNIKSLGQDTHIKRPTSPKVNSHHTPASPWLIKSLELFEDR